MNLAEKTEFPLGLTPIECLSDNHICQSWICKQKGTDSQVFVKTPSLSTDLDVAIIEQILESSYQCQKKIETGAITTAIRRIRHKDRLFIIYPFLSSQHWQPISLDLLTKHLKAILSQVCFAIDYIHLMKLVHRDLKLSNFLINETNGIVRLKLVDLDFLCETGTSLHGTLVGTPEHISPETIRGEAFQSESDIYALGISLQKAHQEIVKSGEFPVMGDEDILEKLNQFSVRLCSINPLERPANLIEALLESELISTEVHNDLNRKLLEIVAASKLTKRSLRNLNDTKRMARFLSEDCLIVGLPNDLITLLSSLLIANKYLEVVRLMRLILRKSKLTRISEYFHISIPDDFLIDILGVNKNHLLLELKSSNSGSVKATLLEKILGESLILKENKQLLRAFLLLKCSIAHLGAGVSCDLATIRLKLLKELGFLSKSLKRLSEAVSFFRQIVDSKKVDPGLLYEIEYELAGILILNGDSSSASDIIDTRLATLNDSVRNQHTLNLKRLKCWIIAAGGDKRKALSTLDELIVHSQKMGANNVAVLCMYTKAVIRWNEGNFQLSRALLEDTVQLADDNNVTEENLLTTTSLSQLCFELAEYDHAIRYGKRAYNLGVEKSETTHLAGVCLSIAASNTRLGDFSKADYWLQQLHRVGNMRYPIRHLSNFYMSRAFLQSNKGDLNACVTDCIRVIQMPQDQLTRKVVGKVYQNLLEVACQRWYDVEASEYSQKATDIFEKSGDPASLAEIQALLVFKEFDSGRTESIEFLSDAFEELMKYGCRYYAALSLFRILLRGENKDFLMLKDMKSNIEFMNTSRCPLFMAICQFLEFRNEVPGSHTRIKLLKSVFVSLSSAGQKYLSLLVAREIVSIYKAVEMHRHDAKFLEQSIRLADEIGNKILGDRLKVELDESSRTSDQVGRLLAVLRDVSIILSDIKNQKDALDSLLKFVVEQTGAERGILLLRDEESDELWTAAHVDCDEQSLRDAEAFSKTIPLRTAKNQTAVVIDDAITDKRTSVLPSIAIHNIRSIACAPLFKRGSVIGAVYLDHHSLASLFSKDDIICFEAITNFISVAIDTSDVLSQYKLLGRKLMNKLASHTDGQVFITEHPMLLDMLSSIPRMAESDSPILITGESGTGKEVLCQLIHSLSPRSNRPLVMLNCAAITSTLIEAELFGIGKNVATGVTARDGKFKLADEGTMFLDEIGDMPLETQAKVLRVLEYQKFEKVGSSTPIRTDIRFIYATNKNLTELIEQGLFREDLYYRIKTFAIEIPPLRDRKCDILLLLEHFLKLSQSKHGKSITLEPDALEVLYNYRWPGNVRELKSFTIEYSTLFAGKKIRASDLPAHFRQNIDDSGQSSDFLKRMQVEDIKSRLEENDWNKARTARSMGIHLNTLRYRIKKYNISKL